MEANVWASITFVIKQLLSALLTVMWLTVEWIQYFPFRVKNEKKSGSGKVTFTENFLRLKWYDYQKKNAQICKEKEQIILWD